MAESAFKRRTFAVTRTDSPAPLELGHGPPELEVFLEPTCPFSKRAFGKLQPLLDAVGEDRLTIKSASCRSPGISSPAS